MRKAPPVHWRKRNKYGARKTKLDGYTFDSKREAAVYAELKLLERAGKINALFPQFPLMLHTGGPRGIKHRIGTHKIDFRYFDCEKKEFRYLEVKGVDHALGKWKRRHAELEYGIEIEVRK